MFCPQCGCEYIEGILKCVDCDVRLTLSPPRQSQQSPKGIEKEGSFMDSPLIELRSYPGIGIGVHIKSYLEENGIPAQLLSGGNVMPLERIMVPERLAEKADRLLIQFDDAIHEEEDIDNQVDEISELD